MWRLACARPRGMPEIACIVEDLSILGAKLIVPDAIPDAFRLYIPDEDVTFEAEVRWRHGNKVGVEFIWR